MWFGKSRVGGMGGDLAGKELEGVDVHTARGWRGFVCPSGVFSCERAEPGAGGCYLPRPSGE